MLLLPYIADWTKRRSTARLGRDLRATLKRECECDSYHGFTCSKHRRIDELRTAIFHRKPKP